MAMLASSRTSTSVTFKSSKPAVCTSLPRRRVVTAAASVKAKAGKAVNYVCLDCGFIYSDTKTAFEDLPGSYACPACSAPKRRFKVLEGSTGKSNNDKSMAERRDKLRDQIEAAGGNPDEGDQEPLLLFGGAAIAFFAAVTYFVTNR
ncbi:MAG: hypothetical protein WDW38_007824 [Sanguina aurantia]